MMSPAAFGVAPPARGASRSNRQGEVGMNAKRIWLVGLITALLGVASVRAQGPSAAYSQTATADPTAARPESMAPTIGPPGQMSSWLVYPRSDECCGNVGA